jgi:hypothetical protein
MELGGVAGATPLTVGAGVVFTDLGALTAGPAALLPLPARAVVLVGCAGLRRVPVAGPTLVAAVFFAEAFVTAAFFVAAFVRVVFVVVAGSLRAPDLAAGRGRVFAMGASCG